MLSGFGLKKKKQLGVESKEAGETGAFKRLRSSAAASGSTLASASSSGATSLSTGAFASRSTGFSSRNSPLVPAALRSVETRSIGREDAIRSSSREDVSRPALSTTSISSRSISRAASSTSISTLNSISESLEVLNSQSAPDSLSTQSHDFKMAEQISQMKLELEVLSEGSMGRPLSVIMPLIGTSAEGGRSASVIEASTGKGGNWVLERGRMEQKGSRASSIPAGYHHEKKTLAEQKLVLLRPPDTSSSSPPAIGSPSRSLLDTPPRRGRPPPIKIPPLKSRGNRPLPLNDTRHSLNINSQLDPSTSPQQQESSAPRLQPIQLTIPSLKMLAGAPPPGYPALSGAHIRRGSRSSNHSSAASSFVSSISQVEIQGTTRSNMSISNFTGQLAQPTTDQKLFSTSAAFDSASLLPPTLNIPSSIRLTSKDPSSNSRFDKGMQGLKNFPSAVDNFASTFDGLGIGVGLGPNGIGPRNWSQKIPEAGGSRPEVDKELKGKETESVQVNPQASLAKITPPSLDSFLSSSSSYLLRPSPETYYLGKHENYGINQSAGPISQPMERSPRISMDSLFSNFGSSSKFSNSAGGTSKNTTPDFEAESPPEFGSSSSPPTIGRKEGSQAPHSDHNAASGDNYSSGRSDSIPLLQHSPLDLKTPPSSNLINSSLVPHQTLSVSEAKRLLTPQKIQKLITSSLSGLGVLEERKLVVRGFESIDAEMESLRLRKAQLEDKKEREGVNRQNILRRHVSCLKAFNGVEGERFGENLVSAVRMSDRLNSELQEVLAGLISLENLRKEHGEAASGLTLAKLNSAFIMEDKFSTFADGHGTIFLEVVTPTTLHPRTYDVFPTTPGISTPRTPMSFRLSELRPAIIPPLPQNQLPTNTLTRQAALSQANEELSSSTTLPFEFPRPAPLPTPHSFIAGPSVTPSFFRSGSSLPTRLRLSPPSRSQDLPQRRNFGRKISLTKSTSNVAESNFPSPVQYRRSNSNPDITTFTSASDRMAFGKKTSQWRLGHQTVISENDLEDLHLTSHQPVEFTRDPPEHKKHLSLLT